MHFSRFGQDSGLLPFSAGLVKFVHRRLTDHVRTRQLALPRWFMLLLAPFDCLLLLLLFPPSSPITHHILWRGSASLLFSHRQGNVEHAGPAAGVLAALAQLLRTVGCALSGSLCNVVVDSRASLSHHTHNVRIPTSSALCLSFLCVLLLHASCFALSCLSPLLAFFGWRRLTYVVVNNKYLHGWGGGPYIKSFTVLQAPTSVPTQGPAPPAAANLHHNTHSPFKFIIRFFDFFSSSLTGLFYL